MKFFEVTPKSVKSLCQTSSSRSLYARMCTHVRTRAHTHTGIYICVCDSVIDKQVNRSQNKAAMRDSKANNKMPSIGKKK